MAGLATLGPTVRALRTETVTALADRAHQPPHREHLTRLSALLLTALLLGPRLVARRPDRAILHASGTAATLAMITGLLVIYAQPAKGYPGSSMANELRDAQEHHVLLSVTAVVDQMTEMVEDAGAEYGEDAIEDIVDGVWKAQLEEQREWPEVTDTERLERAFVRLWRAGIVAEENFTRCQSCGVSGIAGQIPEGTVMEGYAFFHEQDTERVLFDDELCLPFERSTRTSTAEGGRGRQAGGRGSQGRGTLH